MHGYCLSGTLRVLVSDLQAVCARRYFMLFFRRPNHWKAGILFYDTRDPRIVVPNRFGVGWTLNLANKWSWALAGAFGVAALYSRRVRG
jgi:hypothetical protein